MIINARTSTLILMNKIRIEDVELHLDYCSKRNDCY